MCSFNNSAPNLSNKGGKKECTIEIKRLIEDYLIDKMNHL